MSVLLGLAAGSVGAIALLLLADIASSLHAIARHLAAQSERERAR